MLTKFSFGLETFRLETQFSTIFCTWHHNGLNQRKEGTIGHTCFSWSPIQIRLSTKKQLRHFFVILHFPIALQNISKIFILVTDFRTVKIVKIQLFVTSLRYVMLCYVIHIKNVTQEQKMDLMNSNCSGINNKNENCRVGNL